MKKFLICSILLLITANNFCSATNNMEIYVESTLISDNTWQLDYTVSNYDFTIDVIEEATVEFDFDEFDNLSDVSLEGLACDIQVWPAITQTRDGWAFDVLFDKSLEIGESFTGISMQVDYLGDGKPVMLYYEIVDPVTFETITDGYTVPEPTTLLLLGLGGLLARRKS